MSPGMNLMHDDDANWLLGELFSVAPVDLATAGSKLGEVWARHTTLTPEKVGPSDPARTKVRDLPAQMGEIVAGQEGARTADVLLSSPSRREHQWTRLVPDPFRGHPPRSASPSHLEFGAGAAHDEMTALFVDLAELVDPYYGFLTTRAAYKQGRSLGFARGDVDPNPCARAMGQAPHVYHEVCVPDVYWVQIFGPGYLATWGVDLEGAGVRRHRLRNGGVVVWATELPEPVQEVASPEQIAWKKSVYDAVGPERFARNDQPWGDFGERVPLLRDHAARVVGWSS